MAWVRVWPKWQRLLHAGLALTIVAALGTYEGGRLHELAGYTALALVLLRLVLGFGGPVPARFTTFVRAPVVTWNYARALWQGREIRHLSHNPLGAWMVLLLLSLGTGAAATGALSHAGSAAGSGQSAQRPFDIHFRHAGHSQRSIHRMSMTGNTAAAPFTFLGGILT